MYRKYIVPLIYIVIILVQRPTMGLVIRIMNSFDILNSWENGVFLWIMVASLFNLIISSVFPIIILLYLRHHKEFKFFAIVHIINGFLQYFVLSLFEPFSGQGIMESMTGYYVVITLLTLTSFYMVFLYIRIMMNTDYHILIRKVYAPFFLGILVIFAGPHLVFLYLIDSEISFDLWSSFLFNPIVGGIIHWVSLILSSAVLYILFNKNKQVTPATEMPPLEFNN